MPCTPSNFPAGAVPKYVRINATSNGDNTVIAASPGKKIIVLGYAVGVNAAGVVTFQNTAGEPVVYASFEFQDGGGASYAGGPWCPAFEVAVGTGLEVNCAEGVDALGHLTYVLA